MTSDDEAFCQAVANDATALAGVFLALCHEADVIAQLHVWNEPEAVAARLRELCKAGSTAALALAETAAGRVAPIEVVSLRNETV